MDELKGFPLISIAGFPLDCTVREVRLMMRILPGYKAFGSKNTHNVLIAYVWFETVAHATNAKKAVHRVKIDPRCTAAVEVSHPVLWNHNIRLPTVTE